MTRPMMGFGLPNQEETHRREFESPPGYHNYHSNKDNRTVSSFRACEVLSKINVNEVSHFPTLLDLYRLSWYALRLLAIVETLDDATFHLVME
jgi:hypothetical protein